MNIIVVDFNKSHYVFKENITKDSHVNNNYIFEKVYLFFVTIHIKHRLVLWTMYNYISWVLIMQ